MKKKAKDTPSVDRINGMSELRRYKTPFWPDDCPKCSSRMEFVFTPVSRVCTCGFRITATEVLKTGS